MLFDGPHLIYIFASLSLTALFIFLGTKFLKKQRYKDLYLKFWAFITVFLHLLPLWTNFLKGENPYAVDNMLFPIYFCNFSMYLLFITANWSDKSTKVFRFVATMTSYAGMLGALISLFYPDYYLQAGSMSSVGVMKSMLSHSTMLVGCLFLMTGGYFKVKFKENTIVYSVGLLFYGLVGVAVNLTFKIFKLYDPNAMYLHKPPIEGVNFLNSWTIALMMVIVVGLTSFTIERINKKYLNKEL